MNDYWFGLLTHEQLVEAWPVVRVILAKAFKYGHGEYEVDDVPSMVERNELHVFAMFQGWKMVNVMALQIEAFPHKRCLNIFAVAGKDFKVMFDRFYPTFLQFARDHDISRITARCRPAAARFFSRIGSFKTDYVGISKEI